MINLIIQLFGGRGMKSLLVDKQYLGDSTSISIVSKGYYTKINENSFDSLEKWEKEIVTLKEEVIIGFDPSGNPISAYAGDSEKVKIPQSQANKWSGGTVSHNHPNDYGGTFSQQDILTFTKYKFKEMRVVANEGTYRIIATEKADYENFGDLMSSVNQRLQEQIHDKYQKEKEKYIKRKEPKMDEREFEAYRRKKSFGVLHNFYRRNCINYGFIYLFKKNK